MSRAREWVAAYLNADANRSISHPFAYPSNSQDLWIGVSGDLLITS